LLRHAKSSWSQPGLNDHDRPLNQRGQRDAPIMGRRLVTHGVRPSLILTSSAKRARETAKLIAREIGYPIEFLQTEKSLYLADPESILEVIELQDDTFSDIVVCIHNPGITELASRLSAQSIDNVPTCGIVIIEADTDSWSTFSESPHLFIAFDYPKKLEKFQELQP
jgi:phosphohistidine phosphatase